MATRTDSERYEIALAKWDGLHEAGNFSVPQEIGTCAVLLAYNFERDANLATSDPYPVFAKDAQNVADRLHTQGKKVELGLNASRDDFEAVLKDPQISDVVVVGNGTLGRVFLSAPEKRVGWSHVTKMTDHLKTGHFVQRFCGTTPDALNVPMGLLAVNDHSKVHAPLWRYFTPKSANSSHNRFVKPVTPLQRMELADIRETFPQRKERTLDQKVGHMRTFARKIIILSAQAM